jgi:hypothetical protein
MRKDFKVKSSDTPPFRAERIHCARPVVHPYLGRTKVLKTNSTGLSFLPIVKKEVFMGSGKQGYILALLWLIVVSPVFTATISVLVIETGIREGIPVTESSNLWETGLLDVFFDAGHIVSNAPRIRVNKNPNKEIPDEARGFPEEAVRGGADFFILALLDYEGMATVNAPKIKPLTVSLRLFRTNPYKLVYEQVYSGRTQSPGNDELTTIKGIARMLLPHLTPAP